MLIICEVPVCLEPVGYLDRAGLFLTIIFVSAGWLGFISVPIFLLSFPYPLQKNKHPYTPDIHTK